MRDGRIRILHIVSSLNRRGAELSAVRLADRLRRETFSPALWPISSVVRGAAVAPDRTPVLAGGWRRALRPRLRDLVAVLRDFRPHLIHCHGGRALKYAAASRLSFRAEGYVYTKIGSVHPWLDHPLRRAIYGRIFEGLDAIVAVGEEMRRELEGTFRLTHPKLVTIPTGIDARPFERVTPEEAAQRRAALGMRPGEVCLMAVGSLSWEKDPHLLLRVVADLAREGRPVRLVFVGGGPLQAPLRREVDRMALSDRVSFLGVREDVPALLAAADVVVLPSVTEGLPAVLIEAGMAARPAVAFRVGAIDEVIVDGVTGFLARPGDAAALREQLARLAGDRELRRAMGRAARARCRAEFSLERYVARHEALYLELAGTSVSWRVATAGATEGLRASSSFSGEGSSR